jgi:hypothetical protein
LSIASSDAMRSLLPCHPAQIFISDAQIGNDGSSFRADS